MDIVISLKEALESKNSIIIDVRSPIEYEEDHIVGAINIPLLDDEERKVIGITYKNDGKEEAVKKGFEVISPKLRQIYEQILELKGKYEKIIIYCFRAGMRSKSLVDLLNSIGIKTYQLEGGYKAYRTYALNYIEKANQDFEFIILHGGTGVGKTEILWELEAQNHQVLDLEDLAKNSGSVFGYIAFNKKPPMQKYFESLIFDKLYNMNEKYIFVESESKRIGGNFVPNTIMDMISSGKHVLVNLDLNLRSERLVKQYVNSGYKDDSRILESINNLKKRLGTEKVEMLSKCLNEKDYMSIANVLIKDYYDPLYKYSIDKYEYDMVLDSNQIENTAKALSEYYKRLIKKEIVNEL